MCFCNDFFLTNIVNQVFFSFDFDFLKVKPTSQMNKKLYYLFLVNVKLYYLMVTLVLNFTLKIYFECTVLLAFNYKSNTVDI